MNNRPVEQALATQLPTHANDLPPQLLSLSLSLVAQSRSYSTSLKPEEEIARPYACAEIACRRLSRALKLPPLMGHPPCPPRVYKKLFALLDRSLTSSISETKRSAAGELTPSRAASGASTPRSARTPSKTTTPRALQDTPSRTAPVKRTADGSPKRTSAPSSPSIVRKTTTAKPTRPNGSISRPTNPVPDAPGWVMANIRAVCKTLSTPAPRRSTWSRPPVSKTLPPHIFAGVSSILHLVSTRSSGLDNENADGEMLEFLDPVLSTRDVENDNEFKELVNALIVAVYFLVLARRRNPPPTATTTTESSSSSKAENPDRDSDSKPPEPKKLDKKTFAEMRQTALVSLGFPSTEKKHKVDVDQWIALIMELGWANGNEWFENVPMAGELDREDAAEVDSEKDNAGVMPKKAKFHGADSSLLLSSRDASRGGLLPGLGTMMQDRVDWLSEERQEDFLEWKAEILQRIEKLERRGQRRSGVRG